MNDTPTTNQSDKIAHVEMGKRILERIEEGYQKIVTLIEKGHAAGMMSINECHHLSNDAMVLYHQTLSLHCRLTAIAQRNGVDVGQGGAQQRGGPGR